MEVIWAWIAPLAGPAGCVCVVCCVGRWCHTKGVVHAPTPAGRVAPWGEAGGIGAGLHERVEKDRTGNGQRCVLQHSGVCAELCAGLGSIDLTCLLTYVGRGQAASALTCWHVDVRHGLHRRHYLSAPTFLCNRAWPCWSAWRMMKHTLLCSLPGGVACVSACLWTELHEVP